MTKRVGQKPNFAAGAQIAGVDIADYTGWVNTSGWKYATATQFGVAGDATTYLYKGVKISYNDGGLDHGVILSVSSPYQPGSSVSATADPSTDKITPNGGASVPINDQVIIPNGMTTIAGLTAGQIYYVVSATGSDFKLALTLGGSAINLTGTTDATMTISGGSVVTLYSNSDYGVANATLTACRFSYLGAPPGFPPFFNWSPTLSGWSSNPTSNMYRWSHDGTKMTISIRQTTSGTSNNVTHTATLPGVAATVSNGFWLNTCVATDNNVVQAGSLSVGSAASTVSLNGILSTSNNTASGNSRINGGTLIYE